MNEKVVEMFSPNSGHHGVCTECFCPKWIVYKRGETELCENHRAELKKYYDAEFKEIVSPHFTTERVFNK